MHRSFISSIKPRLNTCILLEISSGMITLLEITNFSKVTILETFFLSGPTIFFCLGAYIGCFCTGDTCSGDAYIGSVNIGSGGVGDTVKHLRINLQSYRNLEVEGARLDIRVGAGG